jgi:hypothetical protein
MNHHKYENPDRMGWKLPIMYQDSVLLMRVPNDEPDQDLEGALQIGTEDAISSQTAAILNEGQVKALVDVLQGILKEWRQRAPSKYPDRKAARRRPLFSL